MKRAFFALALSALALWSVAGCRKGPPEVTPDGKAAAQASLAQFFEHFNNPQEGMEGFSVKIQVDLLDNQGKEYRWLDNLKLEKEPYAGKLSNPSSRVGLGRETGTPVTFARQEIIDWMYMLPSREGYTAVMGSEQGKPKTPK